MREIPPPDFVEVAPPHQRARYAVADDVDGQQVVVAASQEAVQTRDLTRGAREEHLPSLLEELFGPGEAPADAALDILAAAEGGQPLDGLGAVVHDLPRLVEPRAEDHAASADGPLGQEREDAARGALHADPLVGVLGGVDGRRGARCRRSEHRADLLAETAVDAGRSIYAGIEKPFGIGVHRDALLRAALRAGLAAAAVGGTVDSDHRRRVLSIRIAGRFSRSRS